MSSAQKAADEFLEGLFEKTYGKEGKDRAFVILKSVNEDLNPAFPRFIPVLNRAPESVGYIDGIAPGEIGVTNKQKWSKYFQEIHVEMPADEKPKAKAKANPKSKEGTK
jgi:hypothetical protein